MLKQRGQLIAQQIKSPNAHKLLESIGAVAGSGVSVEVTGDIVRKLVFTFTNFVVTLVKNGTSTGGGGTKFFDAIEGLILPYGGSSNLSHSAGGDGSFLMSVGTTQADTGGTLSSTEANILPSTAATVSSGVGTCKMKSTSSVPTPGAPLDGTATAVDFYLNAAINADATGKETITVNGTITLLLAHCGDN